MDRRIEYLIVKQEDDFCANEESFKNLLLTNNQIKIENEIIYIGKSKIKFELQKEEIKKTKEISFSLKLIVSGSTKGQIILLEKADKLLRRIIENNKIGFYINTVWDDVSIYYGEKAYPMINKIENKMRKIIYIFMLRNSGSKWVERNIPSGVKDAIKRIQEKEKIQGMYEDCLYYADFIQLSLFFFIKYPLNNNLQSLFKRLEDEKNKDDEFFEIIKEIYEPRSNWDRYFSFIIMIDDLDKKWEELYAFRNRVAHNKRIDGKSYNLFLELINEVEDAFDECLEKIGEIKMTEEEQKAVEDMAENITGLNYGNTLGKTLTNVAIQLNLKDYLTVNTNPLAEALKGYSVNTNPLAEALRGYSVNTNPLAEALKGYSVNTNPLAEALKGYSVNTNPLKEATEGLTVKMNPGVLEKLNVNIGEKILYEDDKNNKDDKIDTKE